MHTAHSARLLSVDEPFGLQSPRHPLFYTSIPLTAAEVVRLLGVFWPVQQYPVIYQNNETITYGGSTVMHSKVKVDGLDPTYKVSPPRALFGAKNKSASPLLPPPVYHNYQQSTACPAKLWVAPLTLSRQHQLPRPCLCCPPSQFAC